MSWNGSNSAGASAPAPKKPAKKSPGITHGLIAGAAIVLIGIISLYFVTSEPDEQPVDKKGPTQIADVEADIATNVVHAVVTNAVEQLPPWQDSFVVDRKKRMAYSKLIESRTNEAGMVTERFRLPNGKTWRRVTDPPPIFTNPSDCAIAMSLGDGSGAPIPPVPGLDDANLDEEFAKSLLSPIVIDPKDSPRVAAMKMAVKSARAEIAKMIKEGDNRSVGQILADHVSLNNHHADMQAQAIIQVNKVRLEEGDAAADEYLEKVNSMLENYGVEPVGQGVGRGRADPEAQ